MRMQIAVTAMESAADSPLSVNSTPKAPHRTPWLSKEWCQLPVEATANVPMMLGTKPRTPRTGRPVRRISSQLMAATMMN
ncbi:hypothetical protein D9M72_591060 [compost metagenome]